MASEWTQDELQAAGEMLYDLAWADEEERFRPKRENWVPRVLAGETPIRTDAVVELACQWNRALAALSFLRPLIKREIKRGGGLFSDKNLAAVESAIAACKGDQ